MTKLKLRGKDLRKIGYPESKAIGIAIDVAKQHFGKRGNKEQVLGMLKQVLEQPELFSDDLIFGKIAGALLPPVDDSESISFQLETTALPYAVFGIEGIEPGALQQMETAMRLPVSLAGALMPDAHEGYGLPIGGVLATDNAVIPFGVGVDIGCRMCMTIYDMPTGILETHRNKLKSILLENTFFGPVGVDKPMDDPIMERSEFREIPIIRKLKDKAWEQLGSSGSGNHFVDIGLVEIQSDGTIGEVGGGTYFAILSHSGSRNLGANIAKHYTDLAMSTCKLPKSAKHLAWLSLDTAAGQEYWLAMTLAGDYASACHHHIHRRLAKVLGEEPLAMIENHHNFAWRERLQDGREAIVHRKGATPANPGVQGIIPGSMIAPGYIVRGKGSGSSLNSASHGAGRLLSRTQALNSITQNALNKVLSQYGVELIGGGLDEAPMAYKNILEVMSFQRDLVEIIGTFTPKIVRMDK
jgi:tRNA-splicing ligase RtcB